jgi:hypothetical protein
VATDETPQKRPGTAGLAWIVTLTILVLGLLPIIVSAFSQDNTVTSVDGDQATYSHWFDQE